MYLNAVVTNMTKLSKAHLGNFENFPREGLLPDKNISATIWVGSCLLRESSELLASRHVKYAAHGRKLKTTTK